ncbi:hypothetical protein H4R35_007001, partial [Dimargaris xerosporica]
LLGDSYHQISSVRTFRDYLLEARPLLLGPYIGSGIALIIFNFIGPVQFGRAWRWYLLAVMFVLEVFLYTHARAPPPNAVLIDAAGNGTLMDGSPSPLFIVYLRRMGLSFLTLSEFSSILHQLYWTLTIALSQLGPLWVADQSEERQKTVQQLAQLSSAVWRDTMVMFRSAFVPYQSPSTQAMVRRKMGQFAVEAQLFQDPELAKAAEAAQKRIKAQDASQEDQ